MFTGEFCLTLKEEIIPILYKLFQNVEAEGVLPISFSEDSITLIPEPDKYITKHYKLMSLMNTDKKILNKILAYRI